MRTKCASLSIVLLLIFAMMVVIDINFQLISNVEAPTIYVDDNNTGFEDGSQANPWNTIQEGIDAAQNGDTVFVSNGTYIENVLMNKTIDLTGEDKDTTIIDGNESDDAVEITANYVSISEFSIMNTGEDWGYAGIYLNNVDDCLIQRNIIWNCSQGIRMYSSSNNDIIHNDINSNFHDGIYIEDYSTDNLISNNNITEIGIRGIGLFYTGDLPLYNDIISNNISSCASGIYFIWAWYNNILENNITDNGEGIFCGAMSNHNTIEDNKIHDNGVGIMVDQSSNIDISKNNISKNEDGIRLWESFGSRVSSNNITSNTEYGVWLSWSGDANIMNNKISDNNFGIELYESRYNKISQNHFIDNSVQAHSNSGSYDNLWNDSYPKGGNFWSDYTGVDHYKGPDQNIIGSDGFGDEPYNFTSDRDNYPLIIPYKPLENYTVLSPGWNLISVPLIQEDRNISSVLDSIDGLYDAVQMYDPTDFDDPWKHYMVGKPFGNDLTQLNESMGIWVHITQPGDTLYIFNGTSPTSNQTISLYPGWNLVGYPSETDKTRDDALGTLNYGSDVDSIWTYDATMEKWIELDDPTDYFEIGQGYWMHSRVTTVWNVPL